MSQDADTPDAPRFDEDGEVPRPLHPFTDEERHNLNKVIDEAIRYIQSWNH